MLKRFIIPIVLFLIGIGFYILGALFKILHWGFGFLNAPNFLIIASLFQLLAISLAILKLLKIYKRKN